MVELKDRAAELSSGEGTGAAPGEDDRVAEATAALVGLGANPSQARKVVRQAVEKNGGAGVEELIKDALRAI